MAWALKCDICGCYVDANGTPTSRLIPTNDAVRIECVDYKHTYEICESCGKKIIDLIEGLKKENKDA
jgi:hypothetical protein